MLYLLTSPQFYELLIHQKTILKLKTVNIFNSNYHEFYLRTFQEQHFYF